MRLFNLDKTIELSDYDISKGYVMSDRLFVAHHNAREASEEVGHYEVIREYPNGGRDVKWVVDKPAVAAREEYDEYEDILVFIPYTEEELAKMAAQREIGELKQKLRNTDYQAIKYAEGMLSAEEYAEMKAQRQFWRDRINELEVIIGGGADG